MALYKCPAKKNSKLIKNTLLRNFETPFAQPKRVTHTHTLLNHTVCFFMMSVKHVKVEIENKQDQCNLMHTPLNNSKRRKVVEQQGQESSPCEVPNLQDFTCIATPFATLVNFDCNILLLIDEYMPENEKLENTHIHWFVAHGLTQKCLQSGKKRQWEIYDKAASNVVHYCSFQELKTYMLIQDMQIPILKKLQHNRQVFGRLSIENQRRFTECLPLVTNRQLLTQFVRDDFYDLDDAAYKFILNNVVMHQWEEKGLIEFNLSSGRPDRIPVHLYPMLPKPFDEYYAFEKFMRHMHQGMVSRNTSRRKDVMKAIIRITRLHD